ncbi:HSP90 family protein [Kineosporia sp. J2-2]|uniref:HSP90 family protein n=1 Tax=Kineosporia corallincola TaxID=2835133 RepID=A0ABS5TN14_9ACTN|nr:HSP90 family protein [Kineosporia corallincola]MBT0772492.1 HSP90 family protein [Kineosporia corallincola]
MPDSPDRTPRPFQVDLRGIVDLLSRSIYSGPQVYLRELLQNGVDAITARGALPGSPPGSIRITPAAGQDGELVFTDNGVGLTAAEVGELLATVGRSSKRDVLDLPRTDRLGQFGIGLLSCFMVSDDIRVLSRAAGGEPPVEWIGSADGTFTVRELDDDEALPEIGTQVRLRPRAGDGELTSPTAVLELATRYGAYLPVPVRVEMPGGEQTVSSEPLFAQPFTAPSPELMALGKELLGAEPLDAVPLHVPGTGTRGTAFVLPFAPSPGARQATRVYLRGMLLSERIDDLLPEWAFFARCVVDTTGLRPTASRESLIQDDALEETRAELGSALRRWVATMANRDPVRLSSFLGVHHLALRALVLHDDELAGFIVPWLPIETSNGQTTYRELLRGGAPLRFAETVDEFRQIAAIARPDSPVINGGYVYDADILRRLPDLIPGTVVETVTITDELASLDVPPLAERPAAQRLQARAEEALKDLDCTVLVRSFAPDTLPALHIADAGVLRRLQRQRAKEAGSGMWASILQRIDDAQNQQDAQHQQNGEGETVGAAGQLCLNWRNRLVRALADSDDELLLARTVRVVHVQALLAAHRPLRAVERASLTDALTDIVHLSAGLGADLGELPDAPGEN